MLFFKERESYPNEIIKGGEAFQCLIRKTSENKIRIEGLLNGTSQFPPAIIELELLPIIHAGFNYRFNSNFDIPTICPEGMLQEEFESFTGVYSKTEDLKKRIQFCKNAPEYWLSSRSKWLLFSFDYVLQTYYKERLKDVNINIGVQVLGQRMYTPPFLRMYCTMIALWGLLSKDIDIIPDFVSLDIFRESKVNLVLANKEFIPKYVKIIEDVPSKDHLEWI